MKLLIIFILAISSAFSWIQYSQSEGPFAHLTSEEFAKFYLMPLDESANFIPPKFDAAEFSASCSISKELDWRQKNSQCIHPIRDQGKWGSCWAFATTEMMSDRYCLQTGKSDLIFSPQKLVNWAGEEYDAHGCQGADTQKVLQFIHDSGMRNENCEPYISGATSQAGRCHSACKRWGDDWDYYFIDNVEVFSDYRNCDTAKEIDANGPVYFSMVVFEDFMNYKGGVYHPTTDKQLGTHAVKCIGWGYDAKEDSYHWICANSWTTQWGEDGFFRIGFNDYIGYKTGFAKNVISEKAHEFVKSILSNSLTWLNFKLL